MVSPPGKRPILLGQALYKVKYSKYNFLNIYIKSEDTEVFEGLRPRPNEINVRSSKPT